MLNIAHYQRNANQNHSEVSSHAIIQKSTSNKCWRGCGEKGTKQVLERVWRKGNALTLLVGMQTSTATMENSVGFLKKLGLELSYDPPIQLLGIHTEETRSERDRCIPVFTAALYTIAGTGSNLDVHRQTDG